MNTPKLFIALKALIQKEGRVLIIRESSKYKDGTQTGRWDLPGGRMEAGLSWEENLKREIMEESGLTVSILEPIHVNEVRVEKGEEAWQIVRVFMSCTWVEGEVKLGQDHDEFKWIDPKEYKAFPVIDNLIPVFEAYDKTL